MAYTATKKDNPFRSSSVNRFGGQQTQKNHQQITLEEEFFEGKLPCQDKNYSLSPAARHAQNDGSLDPNQTFFGRTFNRKLKMRDTFTKIFPSYGHGERSNYSPNKVQSKMVHSYPEQNDLGGPPHEIDRQWTHKKDEIKHFHEAMLRIQNMRRAK